MKNIVKLKDFNENELYEFMKNAFKEGTIPANKEEFKKSFSTDFEDGTLYFLRQFGKGKDDTIMLFLYPFSCGIPPVFYKNLRNQEYCNNKLLEIEYQKLLARSFDDLEYLKRLRNEVVNRFTGYIYVVKNQINNSFFFDEMKQAYNYSEEEIKISVKHLEEEHKKLLEFIDRRIQELSSNSEIQSEEEIEAE